MIIRLEKKMSNKSLDQKLISIGIPVYNGKKFITHAVDSIIKQNYDNYEIIISDNLSDDGTLKILKNKYGRKKKIKIFTQKKHLNPMENFAFTFEKSSGDIFKWLAHDDYLKEKDILEKINILFNDTYNYVFLNNEVNNFVKKEYIKNYMKTYDDAKNKEDFLLKAIENCGWLFYGFYSRVLIKKFIKTLKKYSRYKSYIEGIAIYSNLIEAKTYYMHNKNIVYRITSNSTSNNIDPFNNILSFFNFFYFTLKEILISKELKVLFKLKFTFFFAIETLLYAIRLIISKTLLKSLLKFFN